MHEEFEKELKDMKNKFSTYGIKINTIQYGLNQLAESDKENKELLKEIRDSLIKLVSILEKGGKNDGN